MNIKIRKFRNEDAIKVSNIIKQGWRSIISKNYPEKAVENQIKENSPKRIIEKAKKIKYFVAVEKDKILGFGGYSKEKVHAFFVDPNFHRKGIGGKIIKKVLAEAEKDGIGLLECWSTYTAEKFYTSFGFKRIKKLNLQTKNSSITFILMTKKLDSDAPSTI